MQTQMHIDLANPNPQYAGLPEWDWRQAYAGAQMRHEACAGAVKMRMVYGGWCSLSGEPCFVFFILYVAFYLSFLHFLVFESKAVLLLLFLKPTAALIACPDVRSCPAYASSSETGKRRLTMADFGAGRIYEGERSDNLPAKAWAKTALLAAGANDATMAGASCSDALWG